MKRSASALVLPVGLFLAGCAAHAAPVEVATPPVPTSNPPPPDAPPIPPPTNPPAPLPTWDAVGSGHPAGATNPPSPVLLRTEGGRCFKQWVSPFLPAPYHQDRTTACPSVDEVVGTCGTEIVCPPDAVERTRPVAP